MSIREQILESMARTLFVTAYADACDEYDREDSAEDPRHGSGTGYSRWTDAPRAGAGEDWFDVAPDAEEFDPQAAEDARKLAEEMLAKFLQLNAPHLFEFAALQALSGEWCSEGYMKYADTEHTVKSFGHYIVMQSLGTGVGLNDDTGPGCREWKTGNFEGINL